MTKSRLAFIGAGVIGLSCAWRAASAGLRVTVVDPAPASGASWVAGGMLAPVTEAWPGEEALLELGVESVRRWPGFAEELGVAAGQSAGLRTEGTVVVATGSGDRAELDTLADYLARLGRAVERLSGRELRRLEPALGPDVRGGLSVPGDLAVDNRMLLAALRTAAERAGATFVESAARAVLDDGTRVTGVRTDGADLESDVVIVCAGAHSGSLHPVLTGLVRPVKGEILRLAHRAGAFPPPSRTVRALVDGRPVYVVPRDGGGLVVGATQAETGFDTEVTVGGVRDLLRDAERVLPGIAEYALVESAAGLRPGSPDNLPLVGALGPEGLLVATGHHRNGMLLAPVTADAVLQLLHGRPVPDAMRPADPARVTAAAPSAGRGHRYPEEVARARVDQR
ncbi:glycine oxidase ThiO [Pseudonocardia alaniniphila]|uniref:glycine oxidase n=1 Tax=Pseudonocardia alaniniphila TaxID=75291 RepID=A0ABS9TEK8_9PSEU|nr:glycine oxidase ThiO [Pseudonocardia alaniniphila]MCH6166976.1 glycine oxidase ThiO [Pseudonocardia alaniniphila]